MDKRIEKQIKDTIIHKKYFFDSSLIMFDLLLEEGKDELAINFIRRASVHDNSKLLPEEIDALSKIAPLQEDDDGFTNPNYRLNEKQLDLIRIHWKHNRHHPEFFQNINDMTELDILEMICDWHSRSVEFGTNLIDFVMSRQENRFHFPDEMFEYILMMCKKMVDRSFLNNKKI